MLVRNLAYVSFPAPSLVPRDVVYREYTNFGGARISWTAPVYIMSTDFANVLPADEDPMPLDGNPHPMPGENPPPQPFWAMPPYPALGWNAVPPGHDQGHHEAANAWAQNMNNNVGWGPWEEPAQQPEPAPVQDPIAQDQNSIIRNPSLESDGDDDMAEVQQPMLNIHPVGPLDLINLGIVRVFYGPVLPPAMIWERSFKSLLPEFAIWNVPCWLPRICLPPMPVKFDSDLEQRWLFAVNINKRSSVVIQELNDDMRCLDSQLTGHTQDMPEQSSEPQMQNEFQFTSVIASPLGKRPRQPRLKRTVTMVEESPDFSVRWMTRSCTKRTGMKPTSAISIKPAPL